MNRQAWVPERRKEWWIVELLKDFARNDINEYHKFLWSHHMAYARTYEVGLRFGYENMEASRKIFFSELEDLLIRMKVNADRDISSVFEAGCSLGYQLRYMETDLFPRAKKLRGIDIDGYAIEAGAAYLRKVHSKVDLACADMEDLESVLGGRIYDIMVCCGSLMYLDENAAARVVEVMLRHTGIVLALSGLAHPDVDNSMLEHSTVRGHDKSFIHNIDSMVNRAGGNVLARRWDGRRLVEGHTIYFVYASKSIRI